VRMQPPLLAQMEHVTKISAVTLQKNVLLMHVLAARKRTQMPLRHNVHIMQIQMRKLALMLFVVMYHWIVLVVQAIIHALLGKTAWVAQTVLNVMMVYVTIQSAATPLSLATLGALMSVEQLHSKVLSFSVQMELAILPSVVTHRMFAPVILARQAAGRPTAIMQTLNVLRLKVVMMPCVAT